MRDLRVDRRPYDRGVHVAKQVRPWRVALVAGTAAGLVLGGLAGVTEWRGRERAAAVVDAPSARVSATPSATSSAPAVSADRPQLAAVRSVLDHRAEAIQRRDTAAFVATLDPEAAEFKESQEEMLAALRDVRFDRWDYEIGELEPFDLPEARRRELGPSAFTAQVAVRYQIDGYDHAPATFDAYYTFVRRDQTWYLSGDTDGDALGQSTQRQLWDFGPVTVVDGERSIVLGIGSQRTLEQHAADADAAIPRVTTVWGEGWEKRIVVIAPDTQERMAALLGATADRYQQIAAITRAETANARNRQTPDAADRIVINPAIWQKLGSYGRRIVMTHEVTHVASRAATTATTPLWLSEGFADYVGYLGTGIAPHVAAPELLEGVRAEGPPAALPADADFDPQHEQLAQAYQKAWLACLLIADSYGEEQLVAFYRAAGKDVDAAFRDVLHTTDAEFTSAWSDYVNELAK